VVGAARRRLGPDDRDPAGVRGFCAGHRGQSRYHAPFVVVGIAVLAVLAAAIAYGWIHRYGTDEPAATNVGVA